MLLVYIDVNVVLNVLRYFGTPCSINFFKLQIMFCFLDNNWVILDCPDGWAEFGTSCYLVGGDTLTHSEALDYCETQLADLYFPRTMDDWNFVVGIMSTDAHTWVDANDQMVEGKPNVT